MHGRCLLETRIEDDQKKRERARNKKRDLVVSRLCVASACLFIFALSYALVIHVGCSLFLSSSFIDRLQAAAGNEREAKDAEKVKEILEKEGE